MKRSYECCGKLPIHIAAGCHRLLKVGTVNPLPVQNHPQRENEFMRMACFDLMACAIEQQVDNGQIVMTALQPHQTH